MNKTFKSCLYIMALAGVLAFAGCKSSSSTTTTATNCTGVAISGCTSIDGGYEFPDGNGGQMVCTSSGCADNNTDTDYASGFNNGFYGGYTQGYNDGYNVGYNDGYNYAYQYGGGAPIASDNATTHDTDLQRAQAEQAFLQQRAQFISNQFQMSASSATQLVQLTDKVRMMASQGQMTAADRAAVAQSALAIAGVSPTDVAVAFTKSVAGDDSAANDLIAKAAQNLGMPSASALRDQLLPALGVNL